MENYYTTAPVNNEEYVDCFAFTKENLEQYDIDETFIKVMKKLEQFKIARLRFITGYHLRLTTNYEPRLNFDMRIPRDTIGNLVENNLDSEQAYNEFNIQLDELYKVMPKIEIAYINDCLLCGRSETHVRDLFNCSKDIFVIIKASAIVRFAITFNIVVYK